MNLRGVGLSQNWFGDSPFNKGVIRLDGKHTNLTAGTRNAKHCATACGVEPARGVSMKKRGSVLVLAAAAAGVGYQEVKQ